MYKPGPRKFIGERGTVKMDIGRKTGGAYLKWKYNRPDFVSQIWLT